MLSKSAFAIAATGLALLASICASADELPRRPVFGASVLADPGGVRVQYVVLGSPTERAGLETGDIVKSIATRPVASTADLIAIVRATPVEQPVPLQIERAGALRTLTVTLLAAPKETDPDVDTLYSSITVEGYGPRLGLLTSSLTLSKITI